jgi:hypothetical protein
MYNEEAYSIRKIIKSSFGCIDEKIVFKKRRLPVFHRKFDIIVRSEARWEHVQGDCNRADVKKDKLYRGANYRDVVANIEEMRRISKNYLDF